MDEALGLLPLALKWGKVGTFHLSVPWNALGARPLVITLTDVTLVFRLLNPEEEGFRGEGEEEGAGGDGGLEAEAQRRQRAAKERAVQVIQRTRKGKGRERLAGRSNTINIIHNPPHLDVDLQMTRSGSATCAPPRRSGGARPGEGGRPTPCGARA